MGILLLVLYCCGFYVLIPAQEKVTGGEEGIGLVRRLKMSAVRVHLEWLYLEDQIDQRPAQKKLVRSGRPLEFTAGYLYHGRDGLDEILASGSIPGESYFTRAPHVWAVGAFHKNSHSPAILVVDALDFNRLRNSGRATLEAEVDREHGIMDPYPRIDQGFDLEMVKQIWIDQDTAARFEALIERPDPTLSLNDKNLKYKLIKIREAGLLQVIPGLHHTQLTLETFFPEAYERTGAYFIQKKLAAKIPGFQIQAGIH